MLTSNSTRRIIEKMPGKPEAEIKYDESEIREKLVIAIASQYKKKLQEDQDKSEASEIFKICQDANSVIGMEDYLKRFLTLKRISVMAFLHMTLLIDSWFRYHPNDRLGRENVYGLIVASLCLAHEFHDGDVDYYKFKTENKDDFSQHTHLTKDFAKKADISFDKLCEWMKRFKEGIETQFRYTQTEYAAAQEKFLLLEDRDPACMQLLSDLAEFHPVTADSGKQLARVTLIEKNEGLSIKKILIPRLAARIDKMIKKAKSKPFVPSPFDSPLGCTSVENFLKRFIHPDIFEPTVFIHLAIILDSWVENNRQVDQNNDGYYAVKKAKNNENEPDAYFNQYYSLNENNCRRIILICLAFAESYCDDVPYNLQSILILGNIKFQTKEIVNLANLKDAFIISTGGNLLNPSLEEMIGFDKHGKLFELEEKFQLPNYNEVYEWYHNKLLPEYNLDLTLRQQPVVPDKKDEDPNEEERANYVITSAANVYDQMMSPKKQGSLSVKETPFCGAWINCSLKDYLLRMRAHTKASAETFIYMRVFLDIYLSSTKDNLSSMNVHRLLFTSFVIAWQQKYPGGKQNQNNDLSGLAKIAGISITELAEMEKTLSTILSEAKFCHVQHKEKSLSELYDFFHENLFVGYFPSSGPAVSFRF